MFDNVNLENELRKRRNAETNSQALSFLEDVKSFFKADWERDLRISRSIECGPQTHNLLDSDQLDEDRIFEIAEIKSICLDFKLRFLPSKLFKGKIPAKAIANAKEAENLSGQKIEAFMMVAPASRFQLEDANKDPLLFAPLSDGRFFLIHKWGTDLEWHRRILAWPFKNMANLIATIFSLALVLGLSAPSGLLSETGHYFSFGRLAFTIWNMLFLGAFTSFFWFALNQKFSSAAWNSKTFN